MLRPLFPTIALLLAGLVSQAAVGEEAAPDTAPVAAAQAPTVAELDAAAQAIKLDVLDLEADLMALERDLRYPAVTRWTVFVTMGEAASLAIEEIALQLDGEVVANHRYSEAQQSSLSKRGAHRLHIANLDPGRHRITVTLTATRQGQPYQREQSFLVDKPEGPRLLELRLMQRVAYADPEQQPAPGFVAFHYDDQPADDSAQPNGATEG